MCGVAGCRCVCKCVGPGHSIGRPRKDAGRGSCCLPAAVGPLSGRVSEPDRRHTHQDRPTTCPVFQSTRMRHAPPPLPPCLLLPSLLYCGVCGLVCVRTRHTDTPHVTIEIAETSRRPGMMGHLEALDWSIALALALADLRLTAPLAALCV